MPRLVKNSQEAKDRMTHLRSLRKKKGSGITLEPTIDEAPKEEVKEELVGNGKKTNSWITHVQHYAKENNMTYFNALKDPKLKESYKK
jgi:hypothetical protein